MKKSFLFKLLIIAPALIVTSCGYGLKEVYSGIPYNSTNYFYNYFNVWNNKINPYSGNNDINVKKEETVLDLDENKVFTSIKDANFKRCDPDWDTYVYTYDKDAVPTLEENKHLKPYGPTVCMTKLDDSFKYGVVSKMFDGQMFCNGDFQMSRTQVEPTNQGKENGFGVLFSKESNNASYFMMNFKCSVVYKNYQNLSTYYSDLDLHVGIYLKNDIGYTYMPITYSVDKVPTNSGDEHFMEPYVGRYDMYVCFGFSLEKFDTSRLAGFSLQYEYKDIFKKNAPNEEHPDYWYEKASFQEDIYHSIMLYEVSFPKTTWH